MYELWDLESQNLVESFPSEAEALQAARELIALNRGVYPAALALARVEAGGATVWLGSGSELLARLRASA
jgi:hypothetical protein